MYEDARFCMNCGKEREAAKKVKKVVKAVRKVKHLETIGERFSGIEQ